MLVRLSILAIAATLAASTAYAEQAAVGAPAAPKKEMTVGRLEATCNEMLSARDGAEAGVLHQLSLAQAAVEDLTDQLKASQKELAALKAAPMPPAATAPGTK